MEDWRNGGLPLDKALSALMQIGLAAILCCGDLPLGRDSMDMRRFGLGVSCSGIWPVEGISLCDMRAGYIKSAPEGRFLF